MAESPSSSTYSQQDLAKLTAEAHQLYALLNPQVQGGVQVILSDAERKKKTDRYTQLCAIMHDAQKSQKEGRAQVEAWVDEVKEALPAMIPMLPPAMQPRIEKLMNMGAGRERDDGIKALFNEILNGEVLKRMGPAGLLIRPMLQSMLRKSSKAK